MSGDLLDVRALTVEVSGRDVLKDVTFAVERGKTTVLVGETGSGKSMTCRSIIGLNDRIGAKVTSGSIYLDGTRLVNEDESTWGAIRGRRMVFVPQGSMSALNPVRRIGSQMVETIRQVAPRESPHDLALDLLARVRLPDPDRVLRSFPHELSGGMRQRVMIALALVGDPELMIADEPTTALDVTVQREILELIGELQRSNGLTVLLVTHNLELATAFAHQVVVMYGGTVVEQGTVGQILSAPAHPYTVGLMGATPSLASRGLPLAVLERRRDDVPAEDPCPFAERCPLFEDRCTARPALATIGAGHDVACWAVGGR